MKATLIAGLRCVLIGFALAGAALANTDRQTADGMIVYLGVMPSEMIQGHPAEHPEGQMHGGAPAGRYQYHIVVALFDAVSGTRIAPAQVMAKVSKLGLSGIEKRLDSMDIAGTTSYGNYFRMPSVGLYRIEISIRRHGAAGAVRTTFDYQHPWSAEYGSQ